MNFALSEEVLNQILEYLKKCPYHEVASIIDNIKTTVKSVNLITPESITEGGGDSVQSTQTESQVQTESSQEGGAPDQSQESQVSQ
jgi:hypothetical protein